MKLCVTNFFQGSAIIWMDEHKKVGLWLKMGKIKVNSICEGNWILNEQRQVKQ
jgi:hypothetical protein